MNILITAGWIEDHFAKLIVNSELKNIGAHEVRDLLKSTLIECRCRSDVADHVIGHYPKDSYEKQAKIYPETIRKEYSKGSKLINIFSKFSNVVSGKDDTDELRIELNQKMQELDKTLKQERAEFVTRERNNILAQSQKKTLDKILENSENQAKTIESLKAEIGILKKKSNAVQSIEFCCIGCSTVHAKESCPACGSKMKRIYEDNILE